MVKKILSVVILVSSLAMLLAFGFIYLKYNEKLPVGIEKEKADVLAKNMLESLDYQAFENTNYIEWGFKNHKFQWQKNKNMCTVAWGDNKVELDLENNLKSLAFTNKQEVTGEKKEKLVKKAFNYFNNDSFWLVAPYKIFDKGTERSIVNLDNGSEGLLVTYKSGGSTPGDSYLWFFDDTGKPIAYKMWVQILPIQGIKATWENWMTTESGAKLPTMHKLLFLNLEMKGVTTK